MIHPQTKSFTRDLLVERNALEKFDHGNVST